MILHHPTFLKAEIRLGKYCFLGLDLWPNQIYGVYILSELKHLKKRWFKSWFQRIKLFGLDLKNGIKMNNYSDFLFLISNTEKCCKMVLNNHQLLKMTAFDIMWLKKIFVSLSKRNSQSDSTHFGTQIPNQIPNNFE